MQPRDPRNEDRPATGRRPTLHDVARESGASVTQTSRALNGYADVAEATRRRVVDAAQRIGYSPNLEARRLKKPDAKSHSMGLVLATASQRFSDPWFGELLTALVDEAAANGYELQLSAPLADEDPVASYQRALRANRVDGFVVLRTALHDSRVEYLARSGMPFVTYGESEHVDGHPTVADSSDCIRPAIDHLVALGHRKIACVAEPLEFAIAKTRHQAFLQALTAHGIDPDPSYIVVEGYREEAGFQAAVGLLQLSEPPTALVTFNDLLAIGAMRGAASLAVEVPGELSIVGFDDIHAARYTSPPLTTLRHPAGSIARSLIRQLLHAIIEPGTPEHVYLTPELVVRETTGPAPA